jgi:hypothetical protein
MEKDRQRRKKKICYLYNIESGIVGEIKMVK